MGSFCSSKPAQSTTIQSQTYTPNPQIAQAGTQALTGAETAAAQPFSMPVAPVAGFSPLQLQAFQQGSNLATSSPYTAAAASQLGAAGTPVNQSDINSYLNPYSDAALAAMKKYIFDPQRVATMGNAVQSAGGVGADRLALTSQNLDKTQADAIAQAEAGFYQPAMNMAQQQKMMALNSAQGWMGLQGQGLGNTQFLNTLGTQQQGQAQAEQMAPYQNILARIAYPYQNAQFLAGITGGLAPVFGGTTTGIGRTTTQPSQPSMFSQILGGAGIGLAAANMFGGSSAYNPFGSSPSYGGGNMWGGDAYGGSSSNPLPGLSASDYGPGFAEGGDVEEEPSFSFRDHSLSPIPYIPMSGGSGQNTGAHLNLNPSSGGSGGGGSSSGLGDVMKVASTVLPFLLARGGSVNPWDIERNYADGGDVEEVDPGNFNRIDAAAPPSFNDRWVDMPPAFPPPPTRQPLPPNISNTQVPLPRPELSPIPQPAAPSPMPSPAAQPGINPDLSISDFMMPKDQEPYPDALNRDWGQRLARSPWMALAAASAKLMQTPGPPGVALGKAAEAGLGELTKQRTELRTEQQINQKADELYRHAKSELNKYTRKTPHELAIEDIARGRLSQGNYGVIGVDEAGQPIIMNKKTGPESMQQSPIPFAPTQGGTAMQRNASWLVNNRIAPDLKSAYEMIHQGINTPAVYSRLVQVEKKLLQTSARDSGRIATDAEIEAQARSNIDARFGKTPNQAPLRQATDEELSIARQAVAHGKDLEGVRAKMRSSGIDPSGL